MNKFEELGLSDAAIKAVIEMGFDEPTPIQEKTVPMLLEGKIDLVGLAQTGTGKTAAFGLPLVDLVNEDDKRTQALILAPTRELCLQISSNLERFSEYKPGLNVTAVYGGANIHEQAKQLKKGAQIVTATPGRLIDLINRKWIKLGDINYLVLDEADEMLNMGFKEDIDEILESTPENKRVWLFSATMPRDVRKIAENYMQDPKEIEASPRNTSNVNISHQYVAVHPRDKYLALKRFIDYHPKIFALVFCKTKRDTQQVADHLLKDGYNADSLHGDLSQTQRDKVMQKFRERTLQILVATDVAARGIDVDNITHVFHMNLPDDNEFYTHRSGRTARIGKKGISIAIISPKEYSRVRFLEKSLKTTFTKMLVPTGDEVCGQQMISLIHEVHNVEVNHEEIKQFLKIANKELNDLSKEELIARFTSLEFNRFLNYYRNARDLNSKGKSVESFSDRGDKRYSDAQSSFQRFFINVGRKDGLDVGKLISLICDFSGINGKAIGRIDLKDTFSFFEVESDMKDDILNNFEGFEYSGREVRVEETDQRKSDTRGKGNKRSGGRKSDYGGRRRIDHRSGGDYSKKRSFGGNKKKTNPGNSSDSDLFVSDFSFN